ncbi:hypothetical protein BT63DRAFT_456719 [Microthyrium microscopicum]|uniref:Uncharacterized protein n=1 Tax=Microthyrium microscopicum TaxID=703497 RepID=A0A6A6U661_9PEZI|nr:hypothetical protein BT63DRAFT_456719 [Microthyrium microscopicum]
MTDYINANDFYPPELLSKPVPGISLPAEFKIQSADKSLVGGTATSPAAVPTPTPAPTPVVAAKTDPIRFPSRNVGKENYGDAIARLIGPFSGPGFNLIFRPHGDKQPPDLEKLQKANPGISLPDDDLLELNLTHEIWTFPSKKGNLGDVPNRVAGQGDEALPSKRHDLFMKGIPYTQLVRDVTAKSSGGSRIPVDNLGAAKVSTQQDDVEDIHFEPGLFMHVPPTEVPQNNATICRMASIPHGTTINAQGEVAPIMNNPKSPATPNDGFQPDFPLASSKPFPLAGGGEITLPHFSLTNGAATRLPQKIATTSEITQELVNNPNTLLKSHNAGKAFSQVIQFTVSTLPTLPVDSLARQACPHLAAKAAIDDAKAAIDKALKDIDLKLTSVTTSKEKEEVNKSLQALKVAQQTFVERSTNLLPATAAKGKAPAPVAPSPMPAIGTANIAFLDGALNGKPNASVGKVESTFWISTVVYTILLPTKYVAQVTSEGKPKTGAEGKLLAPPTELQPIDKGLVPGTVPSFVFPVNKDVPAGRYAVEATQIQYSQTVLLNFNTLSWPHISVATVVPVRPILINNARFLGAP